MSAKNMPKRNLKSLPHERSLMRYNAKKEMVDKVIQARSELAEKRQQEKEMTHLVTLEAMKFR